MSPLGLHLLAELWDCSSAIDDRDAVETAMRAAIEESGATLLHLRVHAFEPMGVTAIALLSESHLALHTWPERGYAAADLFTCGDHVRPRAAIDVLRRCFEAGGLDVREVTRGERVDASLIGVGGMSPRTEEGPV